MILTALAACLRVIGLNSGLWWDEIYFLVVSVRQPLAHILTVFPGDNQHPLYSVLAWMSVHAFGEHAWSLRLPAVLFGVASIPMLYLLGASVTGAREAFLAAGCLAVSYHHVWFSQDARGYSALAFWTIASTFLLLRGIRTGLRPPWVAYAVAVSLGMYTHLTMMFVAASHLLICGALAFVGWRKDRNSREWKLPLQAFFLAGALTLLFYAPIVAQVQNFFLHRPSAMRAVSTPRWAVWETARGLILGLGSQGILLGVALIVACGAFSYWKRDRVVFALFVLPVLVTAGGAFLARGTMYPRFYFSLIGFAILLLVRGMIVIPQWISTLLPARPGNVHRWLAPALTSLFAIGFFSASALSLMNNYKYPKQDFEGAIRFVDQVRKNGEPVVTAGASTYPLRQYYSKSWDSVETAEKMQAICDKGHPVWVVYTMPRYLEAAAPGVMEMIRKQFTVIRVFHGTLGDGDVFVARSQPLQPA